MEKKHSSLFLICFQTGTFLVTFGLISFVLTQLTLSGKNFIESLPTSSTQASSSAFDTNNPFSKISNLVQQHFQSGFDNFTLISISTGILILSMIYTLIVHLVLTFSLILRRNGKTASRSAIILGINGLIVLISTIFLTIVIGNVLGSIPLLTSPPIISRPNGSNFKGEDNVIDPTSQIEMSLWILKFSIPLAISILLSFVASTFSKIRDRKIKKLSTAKNYNSL
ncbi:hypothetical protein BY996DRAFT_7554717 [Phakopsora pachyrhizi]|uniref:Expressed protein n=1 Tax=Phakopsora pachyrhizi TaxID=170000 RepID=A0AAV0BRM3_PHAPC|nr:hypothetical protein BY996DRAFT_7884395 [Phakopsora pachyrhizi]KAI8448784.1 hypothetical protein BY996DRAFT_7554717 [Phakopsora pachyrhizi]CAH7682279.1 expressed protein [Phakopsora pachyrhizi]CAH7689747.1 expressed protein [Phakopsora pachyrhizi]